MKKVKIGVLGSKRGADMIKICEKIETVELVAICERLELHMEQLKSKCGLQGVAFYSDFDEFIEHDMDAVVLKVQILDVESHTLRDPDAGPQEQRHQRQIAFDRAVMVFFCLTGERSAAVLNMIEQKRYLVAVQTDDGLFVDLRHLNEHRRIRPDQLLPEIPGVKAAEGGHFPLEALFAVRQGLPSL